MSVYALTKTRTLLFPGSNGASVPLDNVNETGANAPIPTSAQKCIKQEEQVIPESEDDVYSSQPYANEEEEEMSGKKPHVHVSVRAPTTDRVVYRISSVSQPH